ncbi:hypothetical protein SESBI_45813 [Sesbania bispinosa]|nr:hypothetical protein SESBI_45813 [Sesbania bispinosa]
MLWRLTLRNDISKGKLYVTFFNYVVSIHVFLGMNFNLVIHHKGYFRKDSKLIYQKSNIAEFPNYDIDKCDLASLKPLLEDEHDIEFSSSAVEHKVVGHLYVEHLGGVGSEIQDGVGSAVGQEVATDEGDGEDDEGNESEDNVSSVHLNDSEEERTVGLDDGFGGKGTSAVGRRMRKKTVATRRQVPRNNNVGSKWVAKVMIDKLKSSNNMKLNEIMDDTRRNYNADPLLAWMGVI